MLVSPPITRSPNWNLPFEIMCDARDYAIGAVLGQREDKKAFVIYYASKTLDSAQANYTTKEKEFLAVMFALEKFRSLHYRLSCHHLHRSCSTEVPALYAGYKASVN